METKIMNENIESDEIKIQSEIENIMEKVEDILKKIEEVYPETPKETSDRAS